MDSTGFDREGPISNNDIQGTYYGRPSLNIKVTYVKAAIALIIAGYKEVQQKNLVNYATCEDDITFQIDNEMRKIKHNSGSDIIRWVIQPGIQADFEDPLIRCEPDYVFNWYDEEEDFDPDMCLYAEAKRLFGTGASLAGKYVEEGLLDFVEGRYGRRHNFGIMLGYVLIGPINRAVAKVKQAMDVRKAKTIQREKFTPNISINAHPNTHHSSHLQKRASSQMVIIHIFLDFS